MANTVADNKTHLFFKISSPSNQLGQWMLQVQQTSEVCALRIRFAVKNQCENNLKTRRIEVLYANGGTSWSNARMFLPSWRLIQHYLGLDKVMLGR